MALKIGSFVKLKEPVWAKTFGQGGHSAGMNISANNKKYMLEWNKVFKVSETCDSENKIAELNTGDQYDLIHIDFVNGHEKQFEIIN